MIGGLAAALLAGPLAAALATSSAPPLRPATFAEHQASCAGRDGWSDPAPSVRIFGNVYDVGTCGIVVLLVQGDAGAIVIDGATAEAAPSIAVNIERLGLGLSDVKLLLSTHEHGDHAGGLAALQRRTGAVMVARSAARRALESGVPAADDPQRGGDLPAYAGVRVARIVADGEVVRLGDIRMTAHATPGHAPGSTSWSWRSCEGRLCHDIVYADSLTAVAADGYRFTDHPAYLRRFRASIAKIAGLRCDLVVTPHPAASDLYARLAGTKPLVDPHGCAAYADAAAAKLDARLAGETRDR